MADLFQRARDYTLANDARAAGLYPYFTPISESSGSEVVIDGQRTLMLGSNNYLGLTFDPRVKAAAIQATEKFGSSCSGSRFLNGTLTLHEQLEAEIADWLGFEACICVSTGYQTNLAALSAIFGRGDIAVMDRSNHASLYESVRLSYATLKRYGHLDMEDLAALLGRLDPNKPVGVITDGVFSMEGDIAPLPEIHALTSARGARLVVDDAHGVGVMGPNGRGTAEHFGMLDKVDVITGTFSKSFASLGGFCVGPAEVIDYIKHNGKGLVYSASISPAAVGAAREALRIMRTESEHREKLLHNVGRMRSALKELGFKVGESPTAVLPIYIGDEMRCFMIWKELLAEGVYTNPVIPPAVAKDDTLIRTSFMASHTDEQIDRAIAVFEKVGRKAELI